MKRAFLIAGLITVLTTGAHAAMWVGGELGASWLGNADIKISGNPVLGDTTIKNVRFEPAVIGGLTVGYDFVKGGFLGYDWPEWMKYFGIVVDFTYNRVSIKQQTRTGVGTVNGPVQLPVIDGWVTAVAFGPYVHYGFFPDSTIPVGRIHPYLGFGPAISTHGLNLGDLNLGSTTSTHLALWAEAGIRYILLPNVSMDTAFRYRFAQPSWTANSTTVDLRDFNSFNVLARVNYH